MADHSSEPGRRWRDAIGIGALVGLAAGLSTVMLLALPLFGLASALEPRRGTGRSFIETGLAIVVLPTSAIVGVVAGGLTARWRRHGGRLPD